MGGDASRARGSRPPGDFLGHQGRDFKAFVLVRPAKPPAVTGAKRSGRDRAENIREDKIR